MEAKFVVDAEDVELESATFKEAAKRSQALWEDLPRSPGKYRVLTGERPTKPLHIGHLFGTVGACCARAWSGPARRPSPR